MDINATAIPATIGAIEKHLTTATSKDVRSFLVELKSLVEDFNNVASWLLETVQSLIEKINSLDRDESSLKEQLRESRTKLGTAQTYEYQFVDRVQNFFRFANVSTDKIGQMEAMAKGGEMSLIENYIAQVRGFLEQCTTRYGEFLKKFEEARTLCNKITRKCDAKTIEAKTKKMLSKFILAFGVVLSVGGSLISWLITSRIIFSVLLVFLGVGISWNANTCKSNYFTMEEAFRGYCFNMIELNKQVDDVGACMENIERRMLTNTSDDADTVERQYKLNNQSQKPDSHLLHGALDILVTGVKKHGDKLISIPTTSGNKLVNDYDFSSQCPAKT